MRLLVESSDLVESWRWHRRLMVVTGRSLADAVNVSSCNPSTRASSTNVTTMSFAPAVKNAGLEPYRVDRDLSVSIPIQAIEENIRDADVCLADISEETPNVWFEVGYALANGKEIVLVCKEGFEIPVRCAAADDKQVSHGIPP